MKKNIKGLQNDKLVLVINLLTGSHFGGAQIFPHKILKKNHYIYYSGKKKLNQKKNFTRE